jgi:hypothetical protein
MRDNDMTRMFNNFSHIKGGIKITIFNSVTEPINDRWNRQITSALDHQNNQSMPD